MKRKIEGQVSNIEYDKYSNTVAIFYNSSHDFVTKQLLLFIQKDT